MLLVALAVFFGACYILYLRTLQSKFVLFGEKSLAQTLHILISWNANLLTSNPGRFEPTSAQASIYTRFLQTRSLKVSDTPDAPTHSQPPRIAVPQVQKIPQNPPWPESSKPPPSLSLLPKPPAKNVSCTYPHRPPGGDFPLAYIHAPPFLLPGVEVEILGFLREGS